MTTRRRRADLDDEEPAQAPASTRGWEPSCIRCTRAMPGYHARFGLCATCIDGELAQLSVLQRDIVSGKVPRVNPKYAPEHTSNRPAPMWQAGELTPKAIAAREKLGIASKADDEVPF